MNITKMFEMRAAYDAKIEAGQQGKDLLPDKILCLMEAVGKLLGAWRGHHYWSEKREPDGALIDCKVCQGRGFWFDGQRVKCKPCNETGKVFSPLLETYVEGLGLVLSIGAHLNMAGEYETYFGFRGPDQAKKHVLLVNDSINKLARPEGYMYQRSHWCLLWDRYWLLAESLGLFHDQIEAAFYNLHKEESA